MSTTTTTGPMNISPQNISGTCSYKCAYSYNYQKSNVTATNYGSTILLSYEVGTTPPVTFNNIKYNVREINRKIKFSEINKAPSDGNGKVVGLMLFLLDYVEDEYITEKDIKIIEETLNENVIFSL